MSRINFMLGWIEHEKSLITSGLGCLIIALAAPYGPKVFLKSYIDGFPQIELTYRLICIFTSQRTQRQVSLHSSSCSDIKFCDPIFIMLRRMWNEYPGKPRFVFKILGFQGYELFLLPLQSIHYEYSLEMPHWGTSKEHHNVCGGKNKEKKKTTITLIFYKWHYIT